MTTSTPSLAGSPRSSLRSWTTHRRTPPTSVLATSGSAAAQASRSLLPRTAMTGAIARSASRIAADCHIDMPWLPPDLFTANASALMKDRMPYVVEGPDGPQWTTKKGAPFGLVGGIGSTGTKYVPGQNHRVDVMASTGLYDDGKKGIRRPGDPHLRVKDMDRDGVQAEVLFGILGAATRLGDHEAAGEMFRIYNDWLVEFCQHYPERHVGLACLPYGNLDAAGKEG